MPLALSPNETYAVVLASDKKKPVKKRPTFFFKFLTGEEMLNVADINDRMDKTKTPNTLFEVVFGTAKKYLRGWENMIDASGADIPFDIDWLGKIVGLVECQELLGKLLYQLPNLEDKKKLELQSGSNTARRAKGAKVRKSVNKSRRKPSRS